MKMDWQIKKSFSSETLPEAKQSGAIYEALIPGGPTPG